MADKLVSDHYDQTYWNWQGSLSAFAGMVNKVKFDPYVKPSDHVLDFGCGGGYLLGGITCAKRSGVEVNPPAADQARRNGLEVFSTLADVPDNYADTIISNHALEHTKRPLDEVTKLYRVLRPGGLLVMVVPCEGISRGFVKNDINHHLYTWSPMNLGHLVLEAGYEVLECKRFIHKWPPHHQWIAKHFGRGMFDLTGTIWAYLTPSMSQVRVVARRPTK